MPLSNDRRKILERIAKLLALAEGTNFDAEARQARATALRLMAEHNIRQAEAATAEPFEVREIKPYFEEDVQWDRRMKWALAELNNIFCLLRWKDSAKTKVGMFLYTGRPSDLDSFEYMVGLILRQRTREWNDYKTAGGRDGKGKWLYGYAVGLEDKVEQLLSEMSGQMRRTGKQELAPLAIIRQAEEWYREHRGTWNEGLQNFGGGLGDGYQAGRNASLHRGEVATPGRQRLLT